MDRGISTADMDPIDMLEGIAADCKWTHARPDAYSLVIERKLKHGTYGMHVHDTEEEVLFTASRYFACPGYAELELLRMLQLMNRAVRPGTFDFNAGLQRINYSTSLDFNEDRPLAAQFIEARINAMLAVLDATYYCFEAIAGRVMDASMKARDDTPLTCLQPAIAAADAFALFNGDGVGHG